tara:strand:- start:9 stop:191 length:183 start_codon:yes stop_codon:yes gene_type:complete
MKIQKPSTVLPKYFNDFENYFHNSDEKLVSYSYIPEYLKKTTSKKLKTHFKNHLNKEFKI